MASNSLDFRQLNIKVGANSLIWRTARQSRIRQDKLEVHSTPPDDNHVPDVKRRTRNND
jgi:hypothetical protein